MEKNAIGPILLTAGVIVVAIALITTVPPRTHVYENEEPIIRNEEVMPLEKLDIKIEREEPKVSINVTYPEFQKLPFRVNEDIKNFAEGEVANIDSLKLAEIPTSYEASYFLKINYEIEQSNSDFLSLVFMVSVYTGGAHPNYYYKTFNYDAKTGEPVTLATLYPDSANPLAELRPKIKTAVYEALSNLLRANSDIGADPESLLFTSIEDQDAEVFQNFTFGSTYIKFFFSPYDIAPYAVGPIIAVVER